MLEALSNAFSGTAWPYALVAYVIVGFFVTRPTGGFASRVMSAVGWPIEVMQRVTGSRWLPYCKLNTVYLSDSHANRRFNMLDFFGNECVSFLFDGGKFAKGVIDRFYYVLCFWKTFSELLN